MIGNEKTWKNFIPSSDAVYCKSNKNYAQKIQIIINQTDKNFSDSTKII